MITKEGQAVPECSVDSSDPIPLQPSNVGDSLDYKEALTKYFKGQGVTDELKLKELLANIGVP